ncbi:MAG TPA: NADH:ubiquinone oxidoreductase, partial [Cyanothece sp. UBA12306]|nr:NADH:ubiquinone oxidoreductase [Cyanothece sp. UBA12306]
MDTKNRAKWDLTRFWKTLSYFEIIPLISSLQRLFTKGDRPSVKLKQDITMNKILVLGATGGLGKRVVRLLTENNYGVRCLVRDGQKAQKLLPEGVEIIEGDITLPQTLTPKLIENISAVISCIGTRVEPVEGDTPNREKYYQGIKFYLPKVVDTPEQVEYLGMKNITQLAKKYLRPGEKVIFDFTHPTEELKAAWGAVDDVVMGGVSESSLRLANQKAIFSGNVSTANNGGFASVRSRNFDPPLDLSGYQGIQLQVNGDGKRYKFIIRCEGKWDGLGYCYSFNTFSNGPTTIRIPFKELIPVFRAKTVPEAGNFEASR